MFMRMLRAVLILPGTALVLVPGALVWATAGSAQAAQWASIAGINFWLGIGALSTGLFLGIWTAKLFITMGQGTPAPWDPPQKLVVMGPYRHVRNPMISGVLFMLAGEALLVQSWPIAAWALLFFSANCIYFPLSEEKGLERRFGEAYRVYKQNVPRWVPRVTPWRPPSP